MTFAKWRDPIILVKSFPFKSMNLISIQNHYTQKIIELAVVALRELSSSITNIKNRTNITYCFTIILQLYTNKIKV